MLKSIKAREVLNQAGQQLNDYFKEYLDASLVYDSQFINGI